MKSIACAIPILLCWGSPTYAQALRTAAVGCSKAEDASKLAAFQLHNDKKGLETAARPLIDGRACITFTKGLKVDIDEKKPPLACIRLTGDLSCYWVAANLVDEHPGEKGGAGGGKRGGGGGRHH